MAFVFYLAAAWSLAGETRLTVEEPAGVERQQWPVTSGIPLALGTLGDDQAAALFDEGGKEIPLQTEPLARWPDGSIRWLLLDFQIDLAARQTKTLTLRFGPGTRRAPVDRPVRVASLPGGKVTFETGPLRLEYDCQRFTPQGKVWLLGGKIEPSNPLPVNRDADNGGAVIVASDGETFSAANTKCEATLEQSGPVRACVRFSGRLGLQGKTGKKMLRYVARVHAWRGQPYFRVFYTFINDHQEDLMAKIASLALAFEGPGGNHSNATCVLDGVLGAEGRVFQVDENHCLQGERLTSKRAQGWAALGASGGAGLAVGLRDFWQNWPKAIQCSPRRLVLELCPTLPGSLYDGKPWEEENKWYYALRGGQHTFKVGVAKTHEIWGQYFFGKPDSRQLGAFFQAVEEPLLAVADPAYVSATKALGEFPPADFAKFAGYDAWLDRALDVHLKRRDKEREYGMLNYGDWYGERKVNWGNLEYDLAHGMFLQYLRTGSRKYFFRGEQAARHHIDVDVIHAVNPHLKNPWGPPPQVGEIWLHCLNHTGGYYDNASLPIERTYQMGHSTNFGHVWVGGDFEYYFLTGDRRAKEVAIQMADAMVRHCPTAYSDHIRGLGWPIVLVLNAYDATGDKKYLDAATSCWQVLKKHIDWQKGWVVRLAKGHCVHPEPTCYGNVPFMEGLTVSALARYHRATQDPEVLRAITVGIDQMIRECWVEEDKAFRYTACPLSTPRTYNSVCLAAEGMAYEARLTGNQEHLRILREGLRETLRKTGSGDGKSLAQLIHFTPHALWTLETQ